MRSVAAALGQNTSCDHQCAAHYASDDRQSQLTLSHPALTRRDGPEYRILRQLRPAPPRFSRNTEDHRDANFGHKTPRICTGGSVISKL
jgi:hypothetical protein